VSERPQASLPTTARLPINRCNLPAVILGGLTFQRHPAPLVIDGVAELHAEFFRELERLSAATERAELFMRHMAAAFSLDDPTAAGWSRGKRKNADYLRMVRGWLFDADNREAAVLKGWVESRFGLLPRHHREGIADADGEAYLAYMHERVLGLYGSNALEAQLDLLYTYCQYELGRQRPEATHLTLYRGVNGIDAHETLDKGKGGRRILLFNNLNSFTTVRERAEEFGDYILEAQIPVAKVFCFTELLPGMLKGEGEYVVIGGVYEVRMGYL